jgi:tetratricopeptide (TPR) repeat protein
MNTQQLNSSGIEALEEGDPEIALTYFSQAIEQDPSHTQAYFNRSRCFYYLEDLRSAIADLTQAIKLDSGNSAFFLCRGSMHGDLEQFSEAAEDFTQAIEIDPRLCRAYLYRANARRALKLYNLALQDCALASELIEEGDNELAAYAHATRGKVLEAQGKFTQAFTEFDQALTLMPGVHEYQHKRGWVLYQLGQLAAALENYDQAIAADTEQLCLGCHRDRALIRSHLSDHAGAIKDCNCILERVPDDAPSYYLRGLNRLALHDSQGAQDLQIAAQLYQKLGARRG